MSPRPLRRCLAAFAVAAVAGLLWLALCVFSLGAEVAVNGPSQTPATLTLNAAVQWALQRNPALLTFRKNRGIAEAAVQIARQYPFNPIIQDFVWYAQGAPINRGPSVINPVFNEHTSRLDLELRHQGRYRRAMAQAALTRTEWEIAAQELLTSIQVTRAFNTLIYRQGKYRLLDEGRQLTEQIAGLTEQLVQQGTLRPADGLLAQADVVEARNALGLGRGTVIVAENDLRRALGMIDESFEVEGTLEKGYIPPLADILVQLGLERRPDLHALEFAVHEAEQRMKLEIANRYGNPSLGPAMEYSETDVIFTGMWLIWQPPILNQRRGEIRQRRAELARAGQALQQGEISVRQDVFAGLARLSRAEEAVKAFTTQTLPTLRQTREELDKLYVAKQAGVDLAGLIAIRRRLLTARDGYLDSLWEMSQAQVDLAAAVADLSFAGCRAAPLASEADQANTPSPTEEQPPNGEQLPPPTPVPGK